MKKLVLITLLFITGMTLSACQEESPEITTCDEGYVLDGEECVLDTPTCLDDEILNEETNECEPAPIVCGDGEVLNEETNECEPAPIVCGDGEVLNEETNECEPEPLVCPDGYREDDGECVEIRCIPGYVVENGQCVEDSNAVDVCKGINYEYDKDSLVYDLVWSDEFDGTELDEWWCAGFLEVVSCK